MSFPIYTAIDCPRTGSVCESPVSDRGRSLAPCVEFECLLESGALDFHEQKIFSASRREVVGREVLVRGPRGSRFESPARLFECADRIGRSVDLDLACFMGGLDRVRHNDDTTFVNIHPDTLCQDGRSDMVLDWVKSEADRDLVIEISERVPILDWMKFRTVIEMLRNAGVRVALDDFGAGHSNFRAIFEVPVDIVKLDAGLLKRVSLGSRNRLLFERLVEMIKSGRSKVVGEGVETEAQARMAEDAGCDYLQGFWLHRPEAPISTVPG